MPFHIIIQLRRFKADGAHHHVDPLFFGEMFFALGGSRRRPSSAVELGLRFTKDEWTSVAIKFVVVVLHLGKAPDAAAQKLVVAFHVSDWDVDAADA